MNNNDHVPTEEVKKDIADTEAEISQMKREIEGFTLLGDRWSLMRADARRTGIKEREEFVTRLNKILAERKS
jgi:hypothetical protein